jgi:hypothetical protein
MAAIQGGSFGWITGTGHALEYLLPNTAFAPSRKAVIDGLVRAIFFRAILPTAADLQNMHDPAQDTAIVCAFGARLVGRQVWDDLRPLLVIKPKQIRIHGLSLPIG